MFKKQYVLFTLLVFFISCAHKTNDVIQHTEVIPGFEAKHFKNIYFSAQPDINSMSLFKKAGFSTIINLRFPKEGEYSAAEEESAVQSAGLTYIHIPTSGAKPLDDDHINKIVNAVQQNRNTGKILIHCSSGNRVAMWAGGHFFKDHGFTKQQALQVAEQIGLNKTTPKETLQEYLDKK